MQNFYLKLLIAQGLQTILIRKSGVKKTLLVPHISPAAYQKWLTSTRKYFAKLCQGLKAAIFRTHLNSFFKYKSSFLINAYLPSKRFLTLLTGYNTK